MARGRSTKSLDDELDLDLLVVNKELSHSASVPAFPTSKRVLYKRLSLLGGSLPSVFKNVCRDLKGRDKATWKRDFILPCREAGAPNHFVDQADSDQ